MSATITNRVNGVQAEVKTTPKPTTAKPKRQAKSKPKGKPRTVKRKPKNAWELWFLNGITLAMGCGIPVLSLAMSHSAGRLFQVGQVGLACFAGVITLCVLGVSLTHLADAIKQITRSHALLSWALAIAFDCALVCCELVHTMADKAGLYHVGWGVMIGVGIMSMALNCFAFFNHK